jgi:hypothetical protein
MIDLSFNRSIAEPIMNLIMIDIIHDAIYRVIIKV